MNSCIKCSKQAGYETFDYLIPVMTANGIHWICINCVHDYGKQHAF